MYKIQSYIFLFVLACGERKNEIDSGETVDFECETTWSVPYCDDNSLPQAGDGCFEPCTEGGTCSEGTCTEAWVGCGPTEDCDVCGVSDWVCLEQSDCVKNCRRNRMEPSIVSDLMTIDLYLPRNYSNLKSGNDLFGFGMPLGFLCKYCW